MATEDKRDKVIKVETEINGDAFRTIAQVAENPGVIGNVAEIIASRLNDQYVNETSEVWEVVPIEKEALLEKGFIMIAKVAKWPPTKPTFKGYNHATFPLDAIFLKWCPGNDSGMGKYVYFTVGGWNKTEGEKPSLPRGGTYRDTLLDLGLPVHIESFRGLGRDYGRLKIKFLELDAVVYGPDGNSTGRMANENDFNGEEGVLARVGKTMRLYLSR